MIRRSGMTLLKAAMANALLIGPVAALPAFVPNQKQPPAQDDAVKAILATTRFHQASFITFSPDSKQYVTASDDGRRPALFNTTTGKESRALEIPAQHRCLGALFSANGSTIALITSGWRGLFDLVGDHDLPQLEEMARIHGPLALSSDGKLLAAGYQYGTEQKKALTDIRSWDTATGKLLPGECKVTPRPYGIELSDDDQYMVAEFDVLVNTRPPGNKAET